MNKRPFNKEAYKKFDGTAKKVLVDLIENISGYKLYSDLNVELYKECDVKFKKGNKIILVENEVRECFDKIVKYYNTIHIPIRKKNTKADFYVVWKNDFTEFIVIDKKILNKYTNNTVTVTCNHEMNQVGSYIEDFIDIPKKDTQRYIIKNLKLKKLSYN
jgi:uncharacterized protein YlzI (FlbEa/FlbD family)